MRSAIFLLSLLICTSEANSGEFYGSLVLDSNPADASGKTRIVRHNFGFEDTSGLRWRANALDITDGASIPPIFQPIVGGAFNEQFIRAAVVHDRYCDRINEHRVRPWQDTHRMFYDALLTAGVPKIKAKVMFYAVYTFGPRWDKLDKGIPCGTFCINNTPDYNEFYRPDQYDNAAAAAELEEVRQQIELLENADGITIDAIELLSHARHPADEFLTNSITR